MIKTDRKVVAAVLKLTNNYHDELAIAHEPTSIVLLNGHHKVVKDVRLNISAEDADESVKRLIDYGLLRIGSKGYGWYSFYMTSRMKYRHAFWWDSFSKRFIAGFVSGVAVGISVNLLTGPIRSGFSQLLQLLSRLL